MNDLTQLFRFAINGQVGFDPSAVLFWRHHDLQTNRTQSRMGVSYFKEMLEMPIRYNLYELHSRLGGVSFAKDFNQYLYDRAKTQTNESIRVAIFRYGFESGIRTLFGLVRGVPFTLAVKGIFTWVYESVHYYSRKFFLLREVVRMLKRRSFPR